MKHFFSPHGHGGGLQPGLGPFGPGKVYPSPSSPCGGPAVPAVRASYPIYQLGNPQLRIFRPNFFMTLVRPGVPQPEDTVQFRISMQMTRVDVKNYLEKIYNVPVSVVRTRIQYGANNKRNHKNQKVKIPDYKVAYVQLGQGQTFQFPNLFPEKEETPEPGSIEDIQKQFMENEKQRQRADPRRGGVTDWFGL
ncbi:large ribosomal subunit protein uL23m isoform X1 [Emydura macquarii macquarii]|uniref:large ribosomal subunit protein uL23m isoform X1 n=2 Tax=Emydura macquarii macquarii TaxID=1129001 RepID=UPI003529EEC8